jgi:hypothetical protein
MNPPSTSPASGQSPRSKAILRLGHYRFSAVQLLVALVLLFIVMPFVEELAWGGAVEDVLVTVVVVLAVLAVGGRGRYLLIALLLAAPAIIGRWAYRLRPDLAPPETFLLPTMAFFLLVSFKIVRFILRAQKVDANVLCAGISGYLLLGLLWVPAYLLVARISPGAFVLTAGPDAGHPLDRFTAFYFSFITLCTVGYGDVIPVGKFARMLAVMEAVTGLFYMAVLISRLVAIYSSAQPPPEEPNAA